MAGFIVCFDGIDGAGKHTQAEMLKQNLAAKGIKAIIHSYPDYSSLYGAILGSFLAGKVNLSVEELFLLYLADMARDRVNVERELANGIIVIMDRYFFATIAYQTAGGMSYKKAQAIEEQIALPIPKVTFYLDVDAETSLARKTKEKGLVDRFEANKAYLEKVRKIYDDLLSEGYRSGMWLQLDGRKNPDELSKMVLDTVTELIGK